jgi:hypothetical protein
MKKLRILILMALSAAITPLRAQSPAGEDPAKEPIFNVRFIVEVYALAQNDAAQLIAENAGGKARHERALELVKNGKARFEMLLGGVTKSGQRSVVEQVDEFSYGTRFPKGETNGPDMPADWETRNLGYTLEYEPTMSPEHGYCDMNMVPQQVSLQGFQDFAGQKGGAPGRQPIFDTRKMTTSVTLGTGKEEFLGTLSDEPQFGEVEPQKAIEVRLAFGRVDFMEIAPPDPAGRSGVNGTLEHQLSFYSLPREAAREILAGSQKPGDSYAQVQALVGRNEAKLEHITVLKTKSGQRAVAEEVSERYFATTPQPKSTGSSTTIEKRNCGVTLEIEPTIGSNGVVDINLVPQMVRLVSNPGISTTYPAQPVFECRKVTTSLSAALGEQAFIGTFNPPGNTGLNGQEDTDRVWLGFVQTTLAPP